MTTQADPYDLGYMAARRDQEAAEAHAHREVAMTTSDASEAVREAQAAWECTQRALTTDSIVRVLQRLDDWDLQVVVEPSTTVTQS